MYYILVVIAAQTQENGKAGAVIYVDTEGKFRPERLVTISRSRGLDIHTKNLLSNVSCVNAITNYQREEVLLSNSFNSLLENEEKSVSLLIVDSIINNYRAEFLSPNKIAKRQQRLYQLTNLLSRMAQEYGIAVVVTNQINSCPKKSNSTGGGVMAYASNYRICLRSKNASDRLGAIIVKSPYHLENKKELILSEKGIGDI